MVGRWDWCGRVAGWWGSGRVDVERDVERVDVCGMMCDGGDEAGRGGVDILCAGGGSPRAGK